MHALRRTLLSACLALAAAPFAGHAASRDKDAATDAQAAQQAENVRLDYAQVLDVEPVYETANAKRSETVCDEIKVRARPEQAEEEGRWSRFWHGFKGLFGGGESAEPDAKQAAASASKPRCHSVPQDAQSRQPVAYDVDYMYRGMKFRARLPEDPGNRLRIRVSVVPYGVSSQALDPHN